MRTNFENIIRLNIQRLADLKTELERELSDTRVSPGHEPAPPGPGQLGEQEEAVPDEMQEPCHCALHDMDRVHDGDAASVPYTVMTVQIRTHRRIQRMNARRCSSTMAGAVSTDGGSHRADAK